MIRPIPIDGETTKKISGEFPLKNQQRNFLTVSVSGFFPERDKLMCNIINLCYPETIEWE